MTRIGVRLRLASAHDESGFGLVEAIIAIVILSVGLMAVAGLSLTVARQTRRARWQTEQAMAAQQTLERFHNSGYDEATVGVAVDTVIVGGNDYAVTVTVTQSTSRVKDVAAQVEAVGFVNSRTFTTRLYKPRPLPDPPAP